MSARTGVLYLLLLPLLSSTLAADHKVDVEVEYPPDPESEGVGLTAEIHCENDLPREFQFRWFFENQPEYAAEEGAEGNLTSASTSAANRTHTVPCSVLSTRSKATDETTGVHYPPGNHTLRIEVWEDVPFEGLVLWAEAYRLFFIPADISDVSIVTNSSYVQTSKPVLFCAQVTPSLELTGPLQYTWTVTALTPTASPSPSSPSPPSVCEGGRVQVVQSAGEHTVVVVVANAVGQRSAHTTVTAQDPVEGGNLTCSLSAKNDERAHVCCTAVDITGSDVMYTWEFLADVSKPGTFIPGNASVCYAFNKTGNKPLAVAIKKRAHFLSTRSVHYGAVDLYEL